MNAIEIKNLSKSYGDFKLDNINLTLPSGCIMGLIGENGAGKSTTIKLILNMLKSDSGSITVLGKDNKDNFTLTKEDIGVVLDEVGLSGCLKAKQVDKIMKSIFKRWDSEIFFGYLQKLSVPTNKPFKELSRGTKMKLGIAIALSHDAKLLILDEATSGLDPVVRDEITDVFFDFTRDENHSVLISSHIVSDLEKICDYIAFLHKGKLILCEEKDRLCEQHCIICCDESTLDGINPNDIIGRKSGEYGTQAVVKRSAVPDGIMSSPVNIEELFVFMVKEGGLI